jgi:hypothetical protein
VNIINWGGPAVIITGALGVLAVIVVVACYIYWPSWRYSWKHARHVIQLTESEKTPAPEYGSMSMDAEEAWRQRAYEPFADDYGMGPHEREFWRDLRSGDWRTQTFDSLSPETLDREAR